MITNDKILIVKIKALKKKALIKTILNFLDNYINFNNLLKKI